MKAVFMGTPDFAAEILEYLIKKGIEIPLVVSQPDRKKGRGKKVVETPVKEISLKYGIDLIQPEALNRDKEAIERLREIEPDFLVVVAFGQLLSREVLDIPKYSAVNLHGSLLPKYRGAAPIQRAIMNGEKKTGVTIMDMDEGMDTGDIISQIEVNIDTHMDSGILFEEIGKAGACLLYDTLVDIVENGLKKTVQNHNLATYAPMIFKKEAVIDFNSNCDVVVNQIRGLSPFLGAYILKNDKRIKIWKAISCSKKHNEPIGSIIYEKDELYIALADGFLNVLELQLPDKKRMKTAEFLKGRKSI